MKTTADDAVYTDGRAWTRGPQQIYDRLAAVAVAVLEDDLDGHIVLDAGAGTGAMTRELLARGARVLAADRSAPMLAELRRQHPDLPTLFGDVTALSLADGCVHGAVAGFVINHLADPAAALAELARVTRPGGPVLATSFGADDHPVKEAVNALLEARGWTPPAWYAEVRARHASMTATSTSCHDVATSAGLSDVAVDAIVVDFADLSPATVAAYRLGMAHSAPFVASLPANEREALVTEAVATAAATSPLSLPMLVVRGRASRPN